MTELGRATQTVDCQMVPAGRLSRTQCTIMQTVCVYAYAFSNLQTISLMILGCEYL
jgi:hypothetical protein